MTSEISTVGGDDVDDLLVLMEGYCSFYGVAPGAVRLRRLSESLIDNPDEGLQLLARDAEGAATGFATVYWTWQTLAASRIGVMNDLFVAPSARGAGLAERLIAACLDRCRERGAGSLVWQTALDNHRAQSVYERVGGVSERWLDYSLPVDAA